MAFPIDFRRIEPEVRERYAVVLASRNGVTVDEILEDIGRRGFLAVAIPANDVDLVYASRTIEGAVEGIESVDAGRPIGKCYGGHLTIREGGQPAHG